MNPDPSPERPQASLPDGDIEADVPDDEDTGPLHVSVPSPPSDSDWDPGPSEGTWAGRFDAPLTVSPRPVRSARNPNVVLGAVGAVMAVALVVGLIFWLTRSSSESSDSPAAEPAPSISPASPTLGDEAGARLMRLLPRGYPSDSCEAVAPPKAALAQVNCDTNSDAGGPPSATYTLARDEAGLDASFNDSIQSANRVNCPGNIQSPGPWRRNATPDKISGTLFCGLREGRPTVIWTDEANLVVNAAQAGPEGPDFPQLYAWWSSHS